MSYILIHGLGQTQESWKPVISSMRLSEKILCPNLPTMLHKQECNYHNLYASFSQYCAKASEPLNLCGLSVGGILALHYAIDHPDEVASLVLIGTQFAMPKKLLKFQNFIFRLMPKRAFLSMGFSKKDFIQLSKTMMDLDFRVQLSRISCPTLIVCGEKDIANRKASIELADLIPNADLQILHGCGHEVNQEMPEQLAEALDHFYASVSSGDIP